MLGGFYKRSFRLSIALHGVLLGAVLLFSFLQGCLRPKTEILIPIEFTVAAETSEEVAEVRDPDPPTPEPPTPKPPDDPKPPEPLPPEPDRVPDPVKVEPEKPKPVAEKPKPKPEPEKPKPTKPPVNQGRRVVRGPPNPTVKQTLSDAEVLRRMRDGASLGTQDTLPPSERDRNFLQIRRVLYDAWSQPSQNAAGFRPAEAEIRLDLSGRLTSYRIIISSGSPTFDQSVLASLQSVRQIPGLSANFLRQNSRVTVEFKLQP